MRAPLGRPRPCGPAAPVSPLGARVCPGAAFPFRVEHRLCRPALPSPGPAGGAAAGATSSETSRGPRHGGHAAMAPRGSWLLPSWPRGPWGGSSAGRAGCGHARPRLPWRWSPRRWRRLRVERATGPPRHRCWLLFCRTVPSAVCVLPAALDCERPGDSRSHLPHCAENVLSLRPASSAERAASDPVEPVPAC